MDVSANPHYEVILEETPSSPEDLDTIPIPQEEPLRSLHSLSGFSTPQTLKQFGYIKHHKVVVFVDSGSTHNFIHRRVVQ